MLKQFEKELADFHGNKFAIGTDGSTDSVGWP
jgi:hypothetical protein